jgi:hypothetical protein
MFLSRDSSSIYRLISASLSLSFLLSSYNCDYPSPPIVLAAFLCLALITSIAVSVLAKRSGVKDPMVER